MRKTCWRILFPNKRQSLLTACQWFSHPNRLLKWCIIFTKDNTSTPAISDSLIDTYVDLPAYTYYLSAVIPSENSEYSMHGCIRTQSSLTCNWSQTKQSLLILNLFKYILIPEVIYKHIYVCQAEHTCPYNTTRTHTQALFRTFLLIRFAVMTYSGLGWRQAFCQALIE